MFFCAKFDIYSYNIDISVKWIFVDTTDSDLFML